MLSVVVLLSTTFCNMEAQHDKVGWVQNPVLPGSPGAPVTEPSAAGPPTEVPSGQLLAEGEVNRLAQLLSEEDVLKLMEEEGDLAAKGNRAAMLLLAYQLGHGEPRLARAAALCLAESVGRDAAPVLIEALRDQRWEVRLNAAAALGWLDALDEPFVDVVAQRFQEEEDIGVLSTLAFTLRRFGKAERTDALIQRVGEISAYDRRMCFTWLGKIAVEYGDESAVKELVGALSDQDAGVRTLALSALARVRGDDGGYDPEVPPDKQQNQINGWREWFDKRSKAASESRGSD